MADPVAWPPPAPSHVAAPPERPPLLLVVAQVIAVLVLFVGAGLLCGWLWEWWWTAPRGVVGITSDGSHVWYADTEKALRQEFSGTGLFLVVGLAGGVVCGGIASWLLARAELVTLAAIAVGAALASYLMMRLGVHLGPPDVQSVAASADEGTRLPEQLQLSGGIAPYLAFPIGALAITGLVMFVPRPVR